MPRFLLPLPKPDMKFSLIRLSPGQSTGRIPWRHSGWPPVPVTREAPRPESLGCCSHHPARGPSLRRVMLSTPIIATMPSSDFRSALHHFTGHAYRLRRYRALRDSSPQPLHRCRDGSLLFGDELYNRSTLHTPTGSWVLRIQGLRTVHGLRPRSPGSAPALFPGQQGRLTTRQGSLDAADRLLARPQKRLCRDASTVGSPLPPATSYSAAWPLR